MTQSGTRLVCVAEEGEDARTSAPLNGKKKFGVQFPKSVTKPTTLFPTSNGPVFRKILESAMLSSPSKKVSIFLLASAMS